MTVEVTVKVVVKVAVRLLIAEKLFINNAREILGGESGRINTGAEQALYIRMYIYKKIEEVPRALPEAANFASGYI